MNSIRYTASGRLSLWDTLPGPVDTFLDSLQQILTAHSSAVLESDLWEFIETDDPKIASITAICDKIITRGNPTLIDADFERALISDSISNFFRCEESDSDPDIGYKFKGSSLPNNRSVLLDATIDLLDLPYRSGAKVTKPPLIPELQELTSNEESLFHDKLCALVSPELQHRIHRQVLIEDLVDLQSQIVPDHLKQNRVDFVLQTSRIRWVIEVDGSQHDEPGQIEKDKVRDRILRNAGWTVHRISTSTVHNELENWLDQLFSGADKNETKSLNVVSNFHSVKDAVRSSVMHNAAYYTVLIPHAVHRCLRCLLKLYFHGILSSDNHQRILVIEEDVPVVAEAMRMLIGLWRNLHVLSPSTLKPPVVRLDVIGEMILPDIHDPNIETRYVSEPDGEYDLILSNSLLLDEGNIGVIEGKFISSFPPNGVRIRNAVGLRTERQLQWCDSFVYDLSELTGLLTARNGANFLTSNKQHLALQFMVQLIFRKRNFRDGQLLAVSRLLQGMDSVVLLPTGGGKSLIYQLCGLILPGMTVVIDPIISLMTDQVANLNKRGIDLTGEISSTQTAKERESIARNMSEGSIAFVFIAPERLQIAEFRNRLRMTTGRFPISLAVVDEAHCISEWGHDFRPSYLHLPVNLRRFCAANENDTPTMVGLTGTASFAVLADIQTEMGINDEEAVILPKSFDRPELRFHVESVPRREKTTALKRYRYQLPRSLKLNPQNFSRLHGRDTNGGIVFCRHVDGDLGVSNVASELGHEHIYAGRKPKHYTGNWNEYKQTIQDDFVSNRIQELITTKSFGMGIDKPNIRYTIHYTMPESVEAFYQEAGRAGRNGQNDYARCAILYSDDNWDSALKIIEEKDHKKALDNLNQVKRENQGDLFTNLWFLLNSYRGRDQEKRDTLQLWENHLYSETEHLPDGAVNTALIEYKNPDDRQDIERAIYRLMLLGVVEDYTVDWNSTQFTVQAKRLSSDEIRQYLREYLMKYQFEGNAETAILEIPNDTVKNTIEYSINLLIDFVYDEIVSKRKHAILTIGEMCREFKSDEEFRDDILSYLQESEFSDELRTWLNIPFDEIGLDTITRLLDQVETIEEVKRLIGTTRRMLDAAPDNIALHYLSVCARIRSTSERDSSILNETTFFMSHINSYRENLDDVYSLIVALLEEVSRFRDGLIESIADTALRTYGDVSLARRLLYSKIANTTIIRKHCTVLLASSALRVLEGSGYYATLTLEPDDAQ